MGPAQVTCMGIVDQLNGQYLFHSSWLCARRWESLGLSIRPSQISLLKSPPNEVREYTIAPTKQMHLHRYCKGNGDVHKGFTVRHTPTLARSKVC